jgi:hypothetical protein
VRVGATGDGMVQVTPAHPGTLAAGDRILIGANYTNPTLGVTTRGNRSFTHVGPGGPTKVQVGGP